MNPTRLRTTEAAALFPPRHRPSRAGDTIFNPPTYTDKAGNTIEMVWCPQCGDWKHRDQFYRNRARRNGLQSWCRKHDDTVLERVRAYRARKREQSVGVTVTIVDKSINAA